MCYKLEDVAQSALQNAKRQNVQTCETAKLAVVGVERVVERVVESERGEAGRGFEAAPVREAPVALLRADA